MFGKRDAVGTDKVDTLIGKDTELKGTVKSRGVLRVDGHVEGEMVQGGDVVVGEGGRVVAAITARHVIVAGEVRGDVHAEGKLEITSSGRLHGDIEAGTLVIAEGAVFEGTSRLKQKEGGQGASNRGGRTGNPPGGKGP